MLSRQTRIVLSICAALALGGAGLWAWRTRTSAPVSGPSAEVLLSRAAQQDLWKQVPSSALSLPSGEATARPVIAAQVDEAVQAAGGSLTKEQKSGLTQTIAGQLVARSRPSAAHYLAAIDDRCTRWVRPSDSKHWGNIVAFATESLKLSPVEGNQESVLRAVAEYCLKEQGGYFRSFGLGPKGTLVQTFRVRSEPELYVRLQPEEPGELAYWFGASHSAFMLRLPIRSFSEVLKADGAVTCAHVRVVVEVAEQRRYTWQSVWFWDSQNGCWSCHMMARTGGTHGYWMFY